MPFCRSPQAELGSADRACGVHTCPRLVHDMLRQAASLYVWYYSCTRVGYCIRGVGGRARCPLPDVRVVEIITLFRSILVTVRSPGRRYARPTPPSPRGIGALGPWLALACAASCALDVKVNERHMRHGAPAHMRHMDWSDCRSSHDAESPNKRAKLLFRPTATGKGLSHLVP